MTKFLSLLLVLISFTLTGKAQFGYRIEADILTKTRLPDSTFQISKGTFYYDKNVKKIIFDFTFPEKEKIVLFDTTMYRFVNEELISTSSNFLIPEQSFFHLVLSDNLTDFGFEEIGFVANGIEKKKDLIITTWLAPEQVKLYLSKILIATNNKQLYSITILGPDGNVVTRQILKSYQLIDGMAIPHEILIATYLTNGTMYQIINLSNVVLNEEGNNEQYNYDL